MRDTVRHVVVDTSVLAAAFVPQCTDSQTVRDVIHGVFACSHAGWPAIRLYVPAICVAETLGVFDKLRFKERKLSKVEHASARSALDRFVADKHYHQFEQHPRHVLATGLVSPLNYSINGKQGRPMGAADCLIAGMAVLLAHQVGVSDVVLLTAEYRMAEVMSQASRLSPATAAEMGISTTASEVGVSPWSAEIYPRCLNAREVEERELREAFLGWPLPSKICRDSSTVSAEDNVAIWTHYQSVRRDYGFRGREKLLDSPALDDLRTRLACDRGVCLSAAEIYATVASLEKNPKGRRRLLRSASSDATPLLHI